MSVAWLHLRDRHPLCRLTPEEKKSASGNPEADNDRARPSRRVPPPWGETGGVLHPITACGPCPKTPTSQ